jgi:hypothetical protein
MTRHEDSRAAHMEEGGESRMFCGPRQPVLEVDGRIMQGRSKHALVNIQGQC